MPLISTRIRADVWPEPQDGALAAARLCVGAPGSPAQVLDEARQLGFSAVGVDHYVHPDGSWAAVDGGRYVCGYQSHMFLVPPADIMSFQQVTERRAPPCAAARIAARTTGVALQVQLQREGFTPIAPHYYSHADGSFVAWINGAAVRGIGKLVIAAAPCPAESVLQYQRRWATFEDNFLACAQRRSGKAGSLETERQDILRDGFVEWAPQYFEHPDGSWLAYTAAGKLERGVEAERFERHPLAIATLHRAVPQHLWTMRLAIAARAIAELQPAELTASDTVLTDAGFKKTAANFWRHDDASFVAVTGGEISFGRGEQLFDGAPCAARLPIIPAGTDAVSLGYDLWDLDPGNVPAAAKRLRDLGYEEKRPGFFEKWQGYRLAPTYLWAAIEGDQIVCGIDHARFRTPPARARPR